MNQILEIDYKDILGKSNLYDFEPISKEIMELAIIVHKKIGPGFFENIYQNALKYELIKNNVSF
jgi:hypothetical protein